MNFQSQMMSTPTSPYGHHYHHFLTRHQPCFDYASYHSEVIRQQRFMNTASVEKLQVSNFQDSAQVQKRANKDLGLCNRNDVKTVCDQTQRKKLKLPAVEKDFGLKARFLSNMASHQSRARSVCRSDELVESVSSSPSVLKINKPDDLFQRTGTKCTSYANTMQNGATFTSSRCGYETQSPNFRSSPGNKYSLSYSFPEKDQFVKNLSVTKQCEFLGSTSISGSRLVNGAIFHPDPTRLRDVNCRDAGGLFVDKMNNSSVVDFHRRRSFLKPTASHSSQRAYLNNINRNGIVSETVTSKTLSSLPSSPFSSCHSPSSFSDDVSSRTPEDNHPVSIIKQEADKELREADDVCNSKDSKQSCSGNSLVLPPCRICGEKASGFHYGVNSCEACKGFFRRALKRPMVFYCVKNNTCDVKGNKRSSCRFCRYKRCLRLGMSKEAIKTGRYSHKKRTSDTIEVKLLQNSPNAITQNEKLDTILQNLFDSHDVNILSNTFPTGEMIYKKQIDYHKSYHKKRENTKVAKTEKLETELKSTATDISKINDNDKLSRPFPADNGLESKGENIAERKNKCEHFQSKWTHEDMQISGNYYEGNPLNGFPKLEDTNTAVGSPSTLSNSSHHSIDSGFGEDQNLESTPSEAAASFICQDEQHTVADLNDMALDLTCKTRFVNSEPLDVTKKALQETNSTLLQNSSKSGFKRRYSATFEPEVPICSKRNAALVELEPCSHHCTKEVRLSAVGVDFEGLEPNEKFIVKEKDTEHYNACTYKQIESYQIVESKKKDDINSMRIQSVSCHAENSNFKHSESSTFDLKIASCAQNGGHSLASIDKSKLEMKTDLSDGDKPSDEASVAMETNSKEGPGSGSDEFMRSEPHFGARRAEKWVKGYVNFAKTIPGFTSLPSSDQASLLRQAWDEVWILGAYRGYNSELGVAVMPSGKCFHREQMETGWGREYTQLAFKMADRLNGHYLTPEIVTLLKAICIVSPDRCSIETNSKVENIQWVLTTCLLHHIRVTCPDDPVPFSRLVDILTSLRNLSQLAQSNLDDRNRTGNLCGDNFHESFTPF